MAQGVKVLGAKLAHLTLYPRMHTVERNKSRKLSAYLHMYKMACSHTHRGGNLKVVYTEYTCSPQLWWTEISQGSPSMVRIW